jgi:hypothetical protein
MIQPFLGMLFNLNIAGSAMTRVAVDRRYIWIATIFLIPYC